MRPVNSTMHELYKDQPANCSVHTGPILESQDSSSSKTIAPPSVSETTGPISVSVLPRHQYQKLLPHHQVNINLTLFHKEKLLLPFNT